MHSSLLAILISCLYLAGGCQNLIQDQKESENSSDNESKETGKIAKTDILSDLKLSQLLALKVPSNIELLRDGIESDAVSGQKKSREACRTNREVNETKSLISQLAHTLCTLESQVGMKAGRKYKLISKTPLGLMQAPPDLGTDFPSGPGGEPNGGIPDGIPPSDQTATKDSAQMQVASVFIDDSVRETYTAYFCLDDKRYQKVVMKIGAEGNVKGSFKSLHEDKSNKIQISGTFDYGVELAGHSRISHQTVMELNSSFVTHATSNAEIDFIDAGISVVKYATQLNGSTNDKVSLVTFFGSDYGSSLHQGLTATTRSFFGSKGEKVTKEESPSFADGGDLNIGAAMLIEPLTNDFKVEFENSDWDCTETSDFELDTESSGYQACTDTYFPPTQFESSTCNDDSFEDGTEVADVPSVLGD